MAATARLNRVSAVASLTRLSPVSTATTRRGMPNDRPSPTMVTVSGGARTVPRVSAAASPSEGSSHEPTSPSKPAVSTTSVTPRLKIGRRFALRPVTNAPRAAE